MIITKERFGWDHMLIFLESKNQKGDTFGLEKIVFRALTWFLSFVKSLD